MFLQASVILLIGGVCLSACWDNPPPPGRDTPLEQTPPRANIPPPEQTSPKQTHPPSKHPPEQTPPWSRQPPPPRRACWEIRSTRGWYASYWNAFCYRCHSYVSFVCFLWCCTVPEHQTIPTNVTVSKDSDMVL